MTMRMMFLAGVALVWIPVGVAAKPRAPGTDASAQAISAPPVLVKLVRDFIIPFQTFTLPNGLKVIVVTDHSAGMVYTSINYDVGSTYEPAGRSGFAHLFEHIMFNGSENVPGDFFTHLRSAGMLDANGGTSFDVTNYHEAVPTGSLDRVLFMESDRMGHLLGAVTQDALDEQRGVVQNEKRNGDNRPQSIVGYANRAALYPPSHPYGHSVIGSMKDLNAASLADVHQWFKDYYGPNNATLLLAGDIDLATAKAKVTKYFGDIPAGKKSKRPFSPVPVLKNQVNEVLTGPVSATGIIRSWPVPGSSDPANFALDALSALMTGVDGAPISEKLVREDKLFTYVSAFNSTFVGGGQFSIQGTVRDGVDPEVASRALDAAVAAFLHGTPSVDALDRFKSARIIPSIKNLESVSAKGETLLQANMAWGSPARYKTDLQAYLALTPTEVMAAGRMWLERPGYRAMMKPGPRMTPSGDEDVAGKEAPNAPRTAIVAPKTGTRGPLPEVGSTGGRISFPAIERATLANGIRVVYAQSKAVPFTEAALTWNVGKVDASADKPSVIGWMFGLLGSGAAGHDDHWFRQLTERTGISVRAGSGPTQSSMTFSAPTAGFDQALSTGMMLLTRPDFPQERIEETRRQELASLKAAARSPDALGNEVFYEELAPGTPMAEVRRIGTVEQTNAITRTDLQAAFHRWVRPEGARLIIVSDQPLAALLPKLNATLGAWRGSTDEPAGRPLDVKPPVVTGPAKIVLIDMPDQVQASIAGGQLVNMPYNQEALAAGIANLTLGSGFLSRINMNLRENKHWSYGASGGFAPTRLGSTYQVQTQVQPDKVGPAIAEIRKEVQGILTDNPITQDEFVENVANAMRRNSAIYRSAGSILSNIETLDSKGYPDDFYTRGNERLAALTLADANNALRHYIDPAKWVWVVTGNATVIRPQIDKFGLPVEVVTPAEIIKSNQHSK